jgi:competence protein ComEC
LSLRRFAAVLLSSSLLLVAAAGCAASSSTSATAPNNDALGPSSTEPAASPTSVSPSPSPAAAQTATVKASLRITFVDVGQGDAIVLRSGSWTGLIDGGPPGSAGAVAAALRSAGSSRIDCLIITHPHADHIGGLPGVIEQFRPRSVVYAGTGTTATWRTVYGLLKSVGARFRKVRTGITLACGKLRARVLSPCSLSGQPNDDSVVLLLDDVGKRLVFCGDLHGPNEEAVGSICARGPPVYLLKVAHHGSAYSTSTSFLSELRPRFAVISVGVNSYGHPSPQTLARLRHAGTRIYTTQRNGSITLTLSTAGAVTWSFSRSSTPLVVTTARPKPSPSVTTTRAGGTDPTVYITNTGECYHRAGCRYLSHSCIAIKLSRAKAMGYRPCSVCQPPQ